MKKALIALLMGFMALPAIATNTNSIVENLQELIEARDAITNAIVERGGSVISGALKDVPQEILDIPDPPTPTPPVLVSKYITENRTYLASEDNADGYNEVTVEVQGGEPSLGSETFTENTTYVASDYGYDGFDTVEVNVDLWGNVAFAKLVNRTLDESDIPMGYSFDDLSEIGDYAFTHCTDFDPTGIYFGQVRRIGAHAFENTAFQVVSGFSSVTGIADRAFNNCRDLQEVDLAACLEFAGFEYHAATSEQGGQFANCHNLTRIYMPPNVEAIPNKMFYACTNLLEVIFTENQFRIPSIGNAAFYGHPSNMRIYVPAEAYCDWTNSSWRTYNVYPRELREDMTVGTGNGTGHAESVTGSFTWNDVANFNAVKGQPDSKLWIGTECDSIGVSDLGQFYNFPYMTFFGHDQSEVEQWRGYPWGASTNNISYITEMP